MPTSDVFARSDAAYAAWFRDALREWIDRHRAEFEALQSSTWDAIRKPGAPLPEKGSWGWRYLNACVMERIRKEQGWPSQRQYEDGVRLPV